VTWDIDHTLAGSTHLLAAALQQPGGGEELAPPIHVYHHLGLEGGDPAPVPAPAPAIRQRHINCRNCPQHCVAFCRLQPPPLLLHAAGWGRAGCGGMGGALGPGVKGQEGRGVRRALSCACARGCALPAAALPGALLTLGWNQLLLLLPALSRQAPSCSSSRTRGVLCTSVTSPRRSSTEETWTCGGSGSGSGSGSGRTEVHQR
jgi:hypothetical protein